MIRPAWLRCGLFLVLVGSTAAQASSYDDGAGRIWRQLVETQGLSWQQVATVCDADGSTACSGSVGGRDLDGWVWATQGQVAALFNRFLPAEEQLGPGRTSVGGFTGFFAAQGLVAPAVLAPTFSFCITYACGASLSGWLADPGGVASAGWGTTPVSIDGALSVGGSADPATVLDFNGVWLWQPTAAVPEPASALLLAAGLAGLARRAGGGRQGLWARKCARSSSCSGVMPASASPIALV